VIEGSWKDLEECDLLDSFIELRRGILSHACQ
jgi:hypothetical protein